MFFGVSSFAYISNSDSTNAIKRVFTWLISSAKEKMKKKSIAINVYFPKKEKKRKEGSI
jgi:hypothetical protein